MEKAKVLIVVLAVSLTSMAGAGSITTTLYGVDTVVCQESPNANFNAGWGPDATAQIGKLDDGAGNNPITTVSHRAYFKVDLSSLAGQTITGASFSIAHLGRNLDVKSTATNWTDSTMTWNTQPGNWSSWTGNLGSADWFSTWAFQSVVLPAGELAKMQDAIDNGDKAYSLLLSYEGTEPWPWAHASIYLAENNWGDADPYWTITATTPEPATIVTLVLGGFAAMRRRKM